MGWNKWWALILKLNLKLRFRVKVMSQVFYNLELPLCDYSDAYILVSGAMTITGEWENDATKWTDERNKGVKFKNCAPLTWLNKWNK